MENIDQLPANTTGEFARRRPIELPADAPPDQIRSTLRAEVENGLRDVCANWPTGEFDRIVSNVTTKAMKYHGRERRRTKRGSTSSIARYIPGATVVVALVVSATHSLQKFLSLETLPFG